MRIRKSDRGYETITKNKEQAIINNPACAKRVQGTGYRVQGTGYSMWDEDWRCRDIKFQEVLEHVPSNKYKNGIMEAK